MLLITTPGTRTARTFFCIGKVDVWFPDGLNYESIIQIKTGVVPGVLKSHSGVVNHDGISADEQKRNFRMPKPAEFLLQTEVTREGSQDVDPHENLKWIR